MANADEYTGFRVVSSGTIATSDIAGIKSKPIQLEGGQKYILQFKIINYSSVNILNHICLTDSAGKITVISNNLNIDNFSVVNTFTDEGITKQERLCYIIFTPPSTGEFQIGIGRNISNTDTANETLFDIRQINCNKGEILQDFQYGTEELTELIKKYETFIEQTDQRIAMLVTTKDINEATAKFEIFSDEITSQIETIEGDYVTSSTLSQTAEDITATFKKGNGNNLIYNGRFIKDTSSWTVDRGERIVGAEALYSDTCLRIIGQIGSFKSAQQTIYCSLTGDITFSYLQYTTANGSDGTTNLYRAGEIAFTYSDGSTDYIGLPMQTNFDVWEERSYHHTTSKTIKQIRVMLYCRDTDKTIYYTDVKVERGTVPTAWSPNANEANDGIIKMNADGLQVLQGTNESRLDSQALKFYEDGTLYSYIEGGKLRFANTAGTMIVGEVGKARWEGEEAGYVTTILGCEHHHTSALGYKADETTTKYTIPLHVASKTGYLTEVGSHSYQGVNIDYPNVVGYIYLRWDKNSSESAGRSLLYEYNYNVNMVGQAKAKIGICKDFNNEEFKFGLVVNRDTSASGYVNVECMGDLHMGGYNISNAGWVNPVAAASAYTYSLRNSGTLVNNTYGVCSFTEGELRYVNRETCFTMEDEGTYTCYCELPIFMAENIENDYHINIGKIGWGDYRIKEKTPYYFILESQEDGFSFTYEVVGKKIETAGNNAVIANDSVIFEDLQGNITTGEE